MKKPLAPAIKKALWRFLLLVFAAVALQGIFLLMLLIEGDIGLMLYAVYLYVLMPLCALLIPCWAGLGGVHPLAAFFPIGGIPLLIGSMPPGFCGVYLLLSLIGAVAGQEWQKHKQAKKGNHHGGNKKNR